MTTGELLEFAKQVRENESRIAVLEHECSRLLAMLAHAAAFVDGKVPWPDYRLAVLEQLCRSGDVYYSCGVDGIDIRLIGHTGKVGLDVIRAAVKKEEDRGNEAR